MEMRVCLRSEIPVDEARAFTVGGREIVLCDSEGEVYALDGICTHEDLPLDGGEVDDGVLECPWHGARYDVRTGRVLALPATRPITTFPVRVDDEGAVHITLPD